MYKSSVAITGLLFSSFACAGGLYLYETATEDLSLAGAGSAARAQDASTILSNPAGMNRLPDRMMTGGLQALYGMVDYTMDDRALLRGNNPGNIVGWFPSSSIFYSQHLSDTFAAGVGIYGNYGLGLDYGNWAGDQLVKDSTLLGMTLSPALSWQLNERLSWGMALGINYGFLSLTREVNDNEQKQEDHDWALNYRMGLLLDITDRTRAGITYTSAVRYHFNIDGQVNIPQGKYNLPISAQVNAPQQFMSSIVHDINEKWSLMGNLGWQDWSAFGDNEVELRGFTAPQGNKFKDTWHAAVGMQYRPTTQWRVNSGVAYDTSMYEAQENTSLTLPSGAAWRVGGGGQYQVTPFANVGLAVEYLAMETSKVTSPLVTGAYNKPDMWFFSLNYNYLF